MEKKKVVKVDRSPMNPRIWYLELECGHEAWVTSVNRPTQRTIQCPISIQYPILCRFISEDEPHVDRSDEK